MPQPCQSKIHVYDIRPVHVSMSRLLLWCCISIKEHCTSKQKHVRRISILHTPFEKLKSHYKRMLKVELINNLKGAYYRVDLRIKWFFLQTGCGAIYCWKNDIPSNAWNEINNATNSANFLSLSTLLWCKKNICLWKNTLPFFQQ